MWADVNWQMQSADRTIEMLFNVFEVKGEEPLLATIPE